MFEKEAKKYMEEVIAKKDYPHCISVDWQKGAEFGYNKANEWHYVKDGDLPKDNKICLLYLGNSFNPTTGWYDNNVWCFEDDRKPHLWQDTVVAWKEITLPKEE